MLSESEFTESSQTPQTKFQLFMNLYEIENLVLLKVNEIEQKQTMKQLIVINSTGRHRKAPSEFSGSKTIKNVTKRQLINSISTNMMRDRVDPK